MRRWSGRAHPASVCSAGSRVLAPGQTSRRATRASSVASGRTRRTIAARPRTTAGRPLDDRRTTAPDSGLVTSTGDRVRGIRPDRGRVEPVARTSVSRARTVVPGPVRTCIGCRERVAKSELLRVTAGTNADGRPVVVPDPTSTRPGRGAHLHPTTACYDLAVRRRAFSRALRRPGGGLSTESLRNYIVSLGTTTHQTTR